MHTSGASSPNIIVSHWQVPPEWTAYNDHDATSCRVCGKHIDECGYAHWVTRDMLPLSIRQSFDHQHAPPIIRLLRRRWCKTIAVSMDRKELPKLFG